jgi:uncharacterized protein (UPF0371 family)
MDQSFITAIKKFMDALDIEVNIFLSREYYENGVKHVCFKVEAERKGISEYVVYHCYEKGPRGRNKHLSSNEVMGAHDGIFIHLGQDSDVYKYFLMLCSDAVEDYLVRYF